MNRLCPAVLALCLFSLALAARAAPLSFATAEASPAAPYVQAQISYVLRFYQGTDVRDVALIPPAPRLAEVHALGAPATREAVHGGRRYRLTEQRFAVIPFASGPLELSGAHVRGRPPGANVAARWEAPPLRLDVRPAPPGVSADVWLPAAALRLDETWSPTRPAAGALLQRTLRIEAVGVAAAQLPELRFSVPGAIVAARPPRLVTRGDGSHLVGLREQTFDIVPTRPGPLHIPPLALRWWPVGAGAAVLAELPTRTLPVAGEAPAATVAATPPPQAWIAAAALLLGLLLIAAYRCRRCAAFWRLLFSLRAQDAERQRQAWLDWGRARWPDAPPLNLLALAVRLRHPRLEGFLRRLDRQAYHPAAGSPETRGIAMALLRETLVASRPARLMAAHDARRQAPFP